MSMATLTMVKLEYVIQGYHEYKCLWSPEINERLNNKKLEVFREDIPHAQFQCHLCMPITIAYYTD